ncbi:MAG: flagellar basal-body rod modification protein FlgD [Planctomycetota bacterium]|jgi:flagellar basal-body rod modification protein FlgD
MEISSLVGGNPTLGVPQSKDDTVNQTDFLRLLTTQLANQNPLEPTNDAEFLGQLASFSALEESKSQTKAIEDLARSVSANTGLQSLSQASSLIGKNVKYFDQNNNEVAANITGVEFNENGLQLKADTGILIPLGLISSISGQPADENTSTTSSSTEV